MFRSPGAALTFGYGCTIHVGVDVGAGDAEVDVIYIIFIMSVQYIGYLVPHKDKVYVDNWIAVYSCCCFLTLTDPLRIQPWSQDIRNQTKSNRESEMSMESRQKRTDKK